MRRGVNGTSVDLASRPSGLEHPYPITPPHSGYLGDKNGKSASVPVLAGSSRGYSELLESEKGEAIHKGSQADCPECVSFRNSDVSVRRHPISPIDLHHKQREFFMTSFVPNWITSCLNLHVSTAIPSFQYLLFQL